MSTSVDREQTSPQIILVGSPNVGKSSLFNGLTGTYTTVSNYPGTSVEISRGHCDIDGKRYEVLDTPGMYALLPITEEERVARDILLAESPQVVIHVIDARNLDRMLPMTIQLIEAGLPLMLVINIMDEAERIGMTIDFALLQQRLGIPVIGAATARKRGLQNIRDRIALGTFQPASTFTYSPDLEKDIADIASSLSGKYRISNRALSVLLLQKDEHISDLIHHEEGENAAIIMKTVKRVTFDRRADLHLHISLERKRICRQILDGVVSQAEGKKRPFSERLSQLTMNPWTGFPLLLITLYLGLYKFVGGFGAGTVVDFLETRLFGAYLTPWLIGFGDRFLHWNWLRELLVGEYGVLTLGVRYAVAIVLPIVGTFFLAFSVIEDTGYFPRLAMLVDRIFKKIGLNGRAVIPLVLGFGCDTMATIVTRTLETVRERIIATILLALAIPCSAQLGVILGLLAGVPGALAVWTLCMVGLFLIIGFLAARVVPGERPMFYMEIPPLRMPQVRNVLIKTLTRMQWYFVEIFPLFIIASVILVMGKLTGALSWLVSAMKPVMTLLGLPSEAAAAFIFGFFRRDFGAAGLYDMQTSGLLTPEQLTVAAVTLTLFVPCVAQFLVMNKERGWKVAVGIFLFVTLLAFSFGWLLNKVLILTSVLT